MVRHIVAWNYKDGFTEADNQKNAEKIKSALEALPKCIDGIVELKVCVATLPSGNRDVVLTSLFESEEALAAYQAHPEHQKVSAFVGAVMQNRACIDYCE
ncbi:MAG: Dabb family protein [Firmicutes bacterium]|nr:Dabb family protein [Bacillota bacterium]